MCALLRRPFAQNNNKKRASPKKSGFNASRRACVRVCVYINAVLRAQKNEECKNHLFP